MNNEKEKKNLNDPKKNDRKKAQANHKKFYRRAKPKNSKPAEKNTEKANKTKSVLNSDIQKKSQIKSKKSRAKLPGGKLKIIPLGGFSEIGKNLTVLEYENDIIIVDCGMGFPDDDMLGIDLVICDTTYLEQNAEKIRGIFLTHGHEDHIGGIPYFLKKVNVPIYGTRLTLGILENKLVEHGLEHSAKLICTPAGTKIKAGVFEVEFIHSNHSIADAVCLGIKTPFGEIIHTGDFKIDVSPVEGLMMDMERLAHLGNEGVLMLMCDSTNAEHPGHTPSERTVGASLCDIFSHYSKKRLIISTFSSNVHRVQQIIDASVKAKRKVAITGRSMVNVIGAAVRLGYMNVPNGTLINIDDIGRYKPELLTIITTGSQGEPMSALYRIAFDDHDKVAIGADDIVVISASAIPGNEKLVGKIINELIHRGVTVLHDNVAEVHVSGHACQEEIKMMIALTRPKYYMPVHGEYRHLEANKKLGIYMGIPEKNIFISDIGKVLEISKDGAKFTGTVPAGRVLVDGSGVGDVGSVVLKDRKHLGEDGVIIASLCVDTALCKIAAGPEIFTRGFVYAREAEELMENTRMLTEATIKAFLEGSRANDISQMKTKLKDEIGKYIYSETKRRPMILPLITLLK